MASKYRFIAGALVLLYLAGSLLPKFAARLGIPFLSADSMYLPLYWCLLLAAMLFFLPRMHTPGRYIWQGQFIGYALAGAAVFLSLGYIIGFLQGNVMASPYDLTPAGIAINLWKVLPAVLAREFLRAYAVGTAYHSARRPWAWMLLITLLLSLGEMNLQKIPLLSDDEATFIYVCKDALPAMVQSFLLSILVLYGGAAAGSAYAATITLFPRIFPFLPSLPWLADSAFGIAFPAIMALFLRGRYQALRQRRRSAYGGESVVGLSVTLVSSVLVVWFVVGVFPLYPSVVLTGSMEPEILPGDMLLIQRFQEEKEVYALAEGDIISFHREDVTITHRIIEVRHDESGNISFVTKGDNNPVADEELVGPNDLAGKVTRVVPKIGLPVLWFHGGDPIPEGVQTEQYEGTS